MTFTMDDGTPPVVQPTGSTTTNTDVDPLGNVPPVPTSTGVVTESRYNPPPRNARVNGVWTTGYSGPGIVDKRNNLVFGPNMQPYYYDLYNDPTIEYVSMSEDRRASVLERLDLRGLPVDTPEQAISSIGYLMEFGNTIGRDWETALREYERLSPPKVDVQAVTRYRVTNSQDIAAVADQTAQRTLGRKFTADELKRFVGAYQQQELQAQQAFQAGGVVEGAPAVDVAAQSFAQQIAPTEANAYKYLGYVDQLFGSLGSRI